MEQKEFKKQQAEFEKWERLGKQFVATYSEIKQIQYSQAQGLYYCFRILSKTTRTGKGFVKKGTRVPLSLLELKEVLENANKNGCAYL